MILKKVVIFGTSDLAKLIYLYLKRDSPHEVVAFTVNEWALKENSLFDLPVIPFEKIESFYPPEQFSMFIAMGYTNMNKNREKIFNDAKAKNYDLLSFVHPSTKLWDEFEMGENCFVFENNTIQPYVKLGNNVIIWSNNVISHHSYIKDHCFIISHAAIAGNVVIEPNCFVGMNATIRNGITIARECVIGAGAVILEDTKEREVYTANNTTKLSLTSDSLKSL